MSGNPFDSIDSFDSGNIRGSAIIPRHSSDFDQVPDEFSTFGSDIAAVPYPSDNKIIQLGNPFQADEGLQNTTTNPFDDFGLTNFVEKHRDDTTSYPDPFLVSLSNTVSGNSLLPKPPQETIYPTTFDLLQTKDVVTPKLESFKPTVTDPFLTFENGGGNNVSDDLDPFLPTSTTILPVTVPKNQPNITFTPDPFSNNDDILFNSNQIHSVSTSMNNLSVQQDDSFLDFLSSSGTSHNITTKPTVPPSTTHIHTNSTLTTTTNTFTSNTSMSNNIGTTVDLLGDTNWEPIDLGISPSNPHTRPMVSKPLESKPLESKGNTEEASARLREMYGLGPLDDKEDDDDDDDDDEDGAGGTAAKSTSVSQVSGRLTPRPLEIVREGDILARASGRSLLTKDWQPMYWVLDLRKRALLLYRNRHDYIQNPTGAMVKKTISLKHNLRCNQIKKKEYSGLGELHNFMLEEVNDYGAVNAGKFASVNLVEVENLWNTLRMFVHSLRDQVKESHNR